VASLESLPPDERAVLQLVLQRGRTFDDIAEMLAIDRAAVRDRALRALGALGPRTRVPPERRALITDYLLGQLPPRVAEMTRQQLATSAPDRAWARVLAAELTPLARDPLPEIPLEGSIATSAEEGVSPAAAPHRAEGEYDVTPARAGAGAAAQAAEVSAGEGYGRPDRPQRPSSRRGGAVVIGAVAAVVVAGIVVGVVLGTSGSSPHHSIPPPSSTPASTPASSPHTTSTPTTTATKTGTGSVKALATIKLASPSGGKETGEAEIATQAGQPVVIIAARNVPPNSGHNAYAVWLSDGKGHDFRLGFVNPAVKSNGVLETAGKVPATVHLTSYDELLVSLESTSTPRAPSSTVVLKGEYRIG
jgi:hypothetical protein